MQPFAMALAIRDAYWVFLHRKLQRLRGFSAVKREAFPNESISVPDNERSSSEENSTVLEQVAQAGPRKQPSIIPEADMSEERKNSRSFFISSLQGLPLPDLGPGSDLHEASAAFKKRLRGSWHRSIHTPRRGTFFTSGPVGIRGSKGYCRVEVVGEYDPTTKRWLALFMRVKDTYPNFLEQRAQGGR